MITFTPSLSWKSLLKLLYCKQPDDTKLAQYWCKEKDKAIWFSRTAWALHTIARWWEINFSTAPVIWVPAYFCHQSLWPLYQTNAKIVFYPLQEHMLPDWKACEDLEKQAKPDIFIATHYYGSITPTHEIALFCKRHNSLLVEDAAHILIPSGDVGERGHFILYSPYKLFPLAHGAICIERPSVNDFLNTKGIKESVSIQKVSFVVGKDYPNVTKWFIKRILQKFIGDRLNFLREKMPFEMDKTPTPMSFTPQMHPLMKKILHLTSNQIPSIIKHRKECVAVWESLFEQNNIAVRSLTFNNKEIPYVGVFESVHNKAQTIYNTFKKWPLSSWPDLPPEVKANPVLHKATLHFRSTILIAPVHQTLNISELIKRYSKYQPKLIENKKS